MRESRFTGAEAWRTAAFGQMYTDTELACAVAANERRRSNFNDTQYDEGLARSIQDEEIAGYESTLGLKLPGFGKKIGVSQSAILDGRY